jgi:hypothetical protein
MNRKPIFIVTRNGQVEIASKDLKFAYMILQKLAAATGKPALLSYMQITRIMNEHNTFVHQYAPGASLEIITRELLYQRRSNRKKRQEELQEEWKENLADVKSKYESKTPQEPSGHQTAINQ